MNKSDASEGFRAADPSTPAVGSEMSSLKNRYHAAECGKRIRRLRKSRGLTQEKLAEQLHLGTDHIGKVETGKHRCSLELLIEIAEFFDCKLGLFDSRKG